MSEPHNRAEWFRRFRAEWWRVMRPEGSWVPWELRDLVELPETTEAAPPFWGQGILAPAPQLLDQHLQSCIVVPTREALLARLPRGGVVAEVGVSHGDFSRTILEVASPAELHLIDHAVEPGMRDVERGGGGRVRIHQGDSAETLATFADGYFDWIYIDAQHEYEGVARDIRAAIRKVRTDGLLVFNDYTQWSYVEMQPYGVVAAVNELCINDGWEMVYLALPAHMYCDVAVRRRG